MVDPGAPSAATSAPWKGRRQLLSLCATSSGVMNSLRMNPLGPLSVERTSSHSRVSQHGHFCADGKSSQEAAEKFGSVRSEVAYLIWKNFPVQFHGRFGFHRSEGR